MNTFSYSETTPTKQLIITTDLIFKTPLDALLHLANSLSEIDILQKLERLKETENDDIKVQLLFRYEKLGCYPGCIVISF